ncbi:darcynin family protein [Chitinimonas lacunae]|uniref:Darcynin family protein n=1 Tax=Chitinimonas lacunae TaxID=1963018 RepID=A0ABV8MN95_9NEIS
MTHAQTQSLPASHPDGEVVMTVFMLVKTQPEWLAFPVERRFAELRAHLEPILQRHRHSVTLRFFDLEFYTARVTDLWMWEVTDQHQYELVVEALRETPFWDRYFTIEEILPGVENAYAKNYSQQALRQ